ncbi:M14 family metallopeptidase [Gloeobacter kilaueensis]|nr:M14 family metallopeptidase [Gloeobacter kilaueensis]
MQKSLGPLLVPFAAPLPLILNEFGRGRPVLSVVGGLHGHAYNSVYTCHLLMRWLKKQEQRQSDYQLRGRVRVLPAVNAPGLLTASRYWPFDNTDLDRVFPGYSQGETTQRLVSWVFEQVRHSDCCVDLRGPENGMAEWPQVQVHFSQPRALELAKAMGLPVIRVRRPPAGRLTAGYDLFSASQGSLAHNLFQAGIDALLLQAGAGQVIEPLFCHQLLAALIRLMLQMGIVTGPPPEPPGVAVPETITADDIEAIHAQRAGLFVAGAAPGQIVEPGTPLGQIVDPLSADILEEPAAAKMGLILSLRLQPIVLQGSLIACTTRI